MSDIAESLDGEKLRLNPLGMEKAKEIENMPVLASLLPYHFGRGAVISGFNIFCAKCKKEISPDSIKGNFEIKGDGTVVHLNAYCLCFSCSTATPFEAKFFDDGTSLQKGNAGWVKRRWCKQPAGQLALTAYPLHFIKAKWQQIVPAAVGIGLFAAWYFFSRPH